MSLFSSRESIHHPAFWLIMIALSLPSWDQAKLIKRVISSPTHFNNWKPWCGQAFMVSDWVPGSNPGGYLQTTFDHRLPKTTNPRQKVCLYLQGILKKIKKYIWIYQQTLILYRKSKSVSIGQDLFFGIRNHLTFKVLCFSTNFRIIS